MTTTQESRSGAGAARPRLRLVGRPARAEIEAPVLDGPFTETKEMIPGRPRAAGQGGPRRGGG